MKCLMLYIKIMFICLFCVSQPHSIKHHQNCRTRHPLNIIVVLLSSSSMVYKHHLRICTRPIYCFTQNEEKSIHFFFGYWIPFRFISQALIINWLYHVEKSKTKNKESDVADVVYNSTITQRQNSQPRRHRVKYKYKLSLLLR